MPTVRANRILWLAVGGGTYAACGLFSLLITAPLLPDDLAIYLDALTRARTGLDPYQPFGIGTSFAYPPTALALLAPLRALPDAMARPAWMAINVLVYAIVLRARSLASRLHRCRGARPL